MSKVFNLMLLFFSRVFPSKSHVIQIDPVDIVISHVCNLQLERTESKDVAPIRGAIGPMRIAGGAITTITYRVFDRNADRHDPTIKDEPERAFCEVTMHLALKQKPSFTVKVLSKNGVNTPEGVAIEIEPRMVHITPGLLLVKQLAQYFPLLPRQFTGPTIRPEVA